MTAPIAVYGAGGFAREIAWLVEACEDFDVVCFIDDDPATHGTTMNGIDVMGFDSARNAFPDASVVGGVGTPSIREGIVTRAEQAGMAAATIIHPRTELSRWVEVGDGTVICAGNILTTNIRLGRHVQINLDCTIGHDVILGDFTTLAPGVHVSGWVHVGRRVYVGTGATFVNGTKEEPLVVGDDAVIGAGACVTRAVAAGSTVVGVPAKPLVR